MFSRFARIAGSIQRLTTYPATRFDDAHVDYDSYWGDKRDRDHGVLSTWQRIRADIALRHMVSDAPLTLVEIGCGGGAVLAYLKTKRTVVRAIGVDVQDSVLREAEKKGIETLRSLSDPLKSLPVSLRADYVLLFEVLGHMINPERQLRSMLEIAERGVFFSVPNTGYIAHRIRFFFFGRFPLLWRLHPSEHLRFWTKRDLHWWLQELGYARYTVIPYEGVPALNSLMPALFAKGFVVFVPTTKAP